MPLDFDLSKIEGFDWDKGNLEHITRHKVGYIECEEVFFNRPLAILSDEQHSSKEKRYKVFGISSGERKLSLAITIRSNKLRIITARDQSKKEKAVFAMLKKRG